MRRCCTCRRVSVLRARLLGRGGHASRLRLLRVVCDKQRHGGAVASAALTVAYGEHFGRHARAVVGQRHPHTITLRPQPRAAQAYAGPQKLSIHGQELIEAVLTLGR